MSETETAPAPDQGQVRKEWEHAYDNAMSQCPDHLFASIDDAHNEIISTYEEEQRAFLVLLKRKQIEMFLLIAHKEQALQEEARDRQWRIKVRNGQRKERQMPASLHEELCVNPQLWGKKV